jgi:hypothetical protein
MDVLRDKMTIIEELNISNNGMNADEMAELFDSLAGNNSIHSLTISQSQDTDYNRNTYRMNDLSNLLARNTSLRRVAISDTNVEIDGDLSNLAYVLNHQRIILTNNRIIPDVPDVDRQVLIDSIEPVRETSRLNISDNQINDFRYFSGKKWIPHLSRWA